MSHPHADVRQSKVEHSRVGHITRGYASGGAVTASAPPVKASAKASKSAFAVGGAVPAARQDRPGRARGGRAPKSTVNVIIAPQGGQQPPGAPPPGLAAAGPPPMPMKPPMMPPPGPMAGPGGPPPGGLPMPPRSMGGRTYASGGAVKPGPAYEEGKREGTQVTHAPGKNDQKDVGRKRVITYATGGAVEAPKGKMGPKLPGGGRGGLGRLAKAHRAAAR